MLQYYWYHWKYLNKINSITTRNVTNGEGSGPNSLSKGNWAITMQREERGEKKEKERPVRHNQKDFDNDWSEPHFSSKDKWAITMKRQMR